MNTIGTNAEGADSGKCCKCVLLLRNTKKHKFQEKEKNSQKVHSRGIAGDG